jgi:hypothetical protein
VRGEAFHTQIARKPQTSDLWVAIIEFPTSGPEVCGSKISRTSGIGVCGTTMLCFQALFG